MLGDASCQVNLGSIFYRGIAVPQDKAESAKWYQKAALQDLPEALHSMGVLFFQGWEGQPPNNQEAKKFLQKAADKGVIKSKLLLQKILKSEDS
jgi:TPR repeat protein